MSGEIAKELGVTWTQAWLVVVTAVIVYAGVIALTRVFGQRQFSSATTYDLAFIFAIGSVVGRVILVRTSVLASLIGLVTMFGLHALTGWLHHHIGWVHDLMQNHPIVLVAHGELLDDNLRRARTSALEVYEAVRASGYGTIDQVQAAVLERNGTVSVIGADEELDVEIFENCVGVEHLRRS